MTIEVEDVVLQEAAKKGLDAYFEAVAGAIEKAIGGQLTAETMAQMTADQITFLGYKIMRDELLEGGFIQLIHNGYGAFLFVNPFAKALKGWGINELAQLVSKAHKLYSKHHTKLETDMSDDEFMALYERVPEFDALDEMFIENEEIYTARIACYVDDHLDDFVKVVI